MPKDSHPPSFPLYVDDFISDGAVDAMTNEELGIYVRLLCKAWKEDPVGTVPNDDRVLANWGKATPAIWKRCRSGVLRAFVSGDDGRLHQKRMKAEWDKLLAYRDKKSKAGKKGMDNRWHNTAITGDLTSGITSDNLSSSSSFSSSVDDDDDGAKEISCLEEGARVRARAERLQAQLGLDLGNQENRALLAKVAVLWDQGELSEDDIGQVVESFEASRRPIKNRGAWLYRCLDNRLKNGRRDFPQLLAATSVPIGIVVALQGAGA